MVGHWGCIQLTGSQNPPTLSYCCHNQQTMQLSHYTHVLTQWKIHRRAKGKLTTHWQRRPSRLLLIWHKVSGPSALNWVIFKEIQTINTVFVALQCVVTHAVLPQFKHVNRSSFHIYLKHELNMNKHQKVFYFNRGTHHFSSLSPPKLSALLSELWLKLEGKQLRLTFTGHVHLHIFRANNITWNLWKWF